APFRPHEGDVDRARLVALRAVRLVLEPEARAVEEGALARALPFPEERRAVARVAERLRFAGDVPERVLRVAEVQAGEPRPLLAEAGRGVEQAVLERQLEACRGPAARADD